MDAAIATMMCAGVFNAHSLGIGGGFFMTIYTRETREAFHLNARETAPAWTTVDMYDEKPEESVSGQLSAIFPRHKLMLLL